MREATKHTDFVCTTEHEDGAWSCQFCAGGLWACSVCGGFEGSMPTHCPGYQMDGVTIDEVYAGAKDFRWGKWIGRSSRFSPDVHRLLRRANSLISEWNKSGEFGRKVKR